MLVDDFDDDEFLEDSKQPYVLENVAHELVLSGDISSLHSMASQNNPYSFRIVGRYIGKEVPILIDMGSTHNFVQPSIVDRLQIPNHNILPFHIYIGNVDVLLVHDYAHKLL